MAVVRQIWRRELSRKETRAEAMLPSVPLPLVSTVVVVAPSGHRVEGLSLQQVALLLQELA